MVACWSTRRTLEAIETATGKQTLFKRVGQDSKVGAEPAGDAPMMLKSIGIDGREKGIDRVVIGREGDVIAYAGWMRRACANHKASLIGRELNS